LIYDFARSQGTGKIKRHRELLIHKFTKGKKWNCTWNCISKISALNDNVEPQLRQTVTN
jgi:hypothetical protein